MRFCTHWCRNRDYLSTVQLAILVNMPTLWQPHVQHSTVCRCRQVLVKFRILLNPQLQELGETLLECVSSQFHNSNHAVTIYLHDFALHDFALSRCIA